ncbi:Mitogen-activated protein kinase kinase kinase 3 [Dendrobium catenatum]|uniref:Mitogen-activated protein kinase kinase kinase 3 n=1 Tax=Dendrobium catenatum TaxID=906689 RepID=A0A2I0VVS0_9ASPA|nr:Mitogen-activated protein kinase kinase kinase 3 [Dendrobium catenatum]
MGLGLGLGFSPKVSASPSALFPEETNDDASPIWWRKPSNPRRIRKEDARSIRIGSAFFLSPFESRRKRWRRPWQPHYGKDEIAFEEIEDVVGPMETNDDASLIRCRKGELIGCGAFGHVYMGMNLDSEELLAVKQVYSFISSAYFNFDRD